MNPKVSIIIVNWNGKEYLKDCLSSVFNQTYTNFEVILVDNGSTDDSINFVKNKFPQVNIIQLSENTGYARGNNIGIKYTLEKHNSDYILLLNNDTKIIQKNTLSELIKITESDKKIGIISCRLASPVNRNEEKFEDVGVRIIPAGVYFIKPQEINTLQPYEVDAVTGAVLLIKREVIDKIGLLDEGFSPFLFEDMDYCIRAKKTGYAIIFVPSLEILHYRSASIKRKNSLYISFVLKKNSIRFYLLNSSLSVVIKRIFIDNNPYSFFTFLLERKNKEKKLTLANLKIRNNLWTVIRYFFKAYFINIVNLKEIMWKRKHRTERLWF